MDSLIWLCVCDVVNKVLSTAVVGSGEGGTSVYTAVGGARKASDVEGFGSSDDSDSNASNKYKLNSHILERCKPKLLQRNPVIELLRA